MNPNTFSYQIFDRFNQFKIWRRIVTISYLLIYLIYLGWRSTIFAEHSLFLSTLYFIAETIGFILSLTIIFNSWNYNHQEPKKTKENLKADIFIPTYQEPFDIIKRTICAAQNIDYPHQLWVLDDGKRDDIFHLTQQMGVHYITRPSNLHAKAGNLNHALQSSSAEFIMVFDADHIALPHALDVTLGFFDDPKVGMVQTPQDYYNTDGFQYMSFHQKIWHDQSFFYHVSQPCQDSSNSSSCVGTGVVYRRSVLDTIDGFPTTTVTEDIHTSLKIHKAGYQTIYLNESIAYGVAAADLTEYYKTRHRWAHGNIHALKHEKILTCKGLSFKQRISYLSLGLIYLEGWQTLLLFLIPAITLIFGIPPFEISVFNILIVLGFPFVSYLMLQEIGCGFSNFWANEIFAIIRWPIHIISTAGLFGKKIAWISSSKKIKSEVNWRFMMPQISVLILSIFSIVFALIKLENNYQPGPIFLFVKDYCQLLFTKKTYASSAANNNLLYNSHFINIHTTIKNGYSIDLVFIAGFWVLYTIVKHLFFIQKVLKNVQSSNTYFHFDIPLPILYEGCVHGKTLKISEDYISFCIPINSTHNENNGDKKEITLYLPSQTITLLIEIIKKKRQKNTQNTILEAKVIWKNESDRDSLANCIYSVNWHRDLFHNIKDNFFATTSEVIYKYLTLRFLNKKTVPVWNPILYKKKDPNDSDQQEHCAFLSNFDNSKATLVTFENLTGNQLDACQVSDDGKIVTLNVLREEINYMNTRKCLDKSTMRRYTVVMT